MDDRGRARSALESRHSMGRISPRLTLHHNGVFMLVTDKRKPTYELDAFKAANEVLKEAGAFADEKTG